MFHLIFKGFKGFRGLDTFRHDLLLVLMIVTHNLAGVLLLLLTLLLLFSLLLDYLLRHLIDLWHEIVLTLLILHVNDSSHLLFLIQHFPIVQKLFLLSRREV